MSSVIKLRTDAFDALEVEAAMIATVFDPDNPWRPLLNDEILGTTTGDVSINYSIDTQDYGADVNGFPNNVMEMKRKTGETASISFNSITFNAQNTKWALGAADISYRSNGVKVVKPRKNINLSDFEDLYAYCEKADGGMYVVLLRNALSTGGLAITTSKNNKGQMQQTITGHVSLAEQTLMPMEIYEVAPENADVYVNVKQTLDEHITSSIAATSFEFGEELTGTLTAAAGYTFDQVAIYMGGADISGLTGVWDASTGAIDIEVVTGDIEIVATSKTE